MLVDIDEKMIVEINPACCQSLWKCSMDEAETIKKSRCGSLVYVEQTGSELQKATLLMTGNKPTALPILRRQSSVWKAWQFDRCAVMLRQRSVSALRPK